MGDVHYRDINGHLQNMDVILHDEAELDLLDFPIAAEGKDLYDYKLEIIKTARAFDNVDRSRCSFQALKHPLAIKIPRNIQKGYIVGSGANRLRFVPVDCSATFGMIDEATKDRVLYQDVWADSDVTLELKANCLKETITLKTDKAPTTLTFKVEGDLSDDLIAGNLILQPAWLMDANGIKRDVTQILRREETGVFLDLAADVEGLTFPVIIDPTLSVTPDPTAGIDTYVSTGEPYTNYGAAPAMIVGRGNDANHYSLIKFDLSSIPAGAIISSGIMTLYNHAGNMDYSTTVSAYPITSAWDESTVTYNTSPTYSTGSGSTSKLISVVSQFYEFDLKTFFQNIVDGQANYGVWLCDAINTTGPSDVSLKYFTTSDGEASFRPSITIIYNSPPTAPVVTYPNGGEQINASHTVTWTASTDVDHDPSSLQYEVTLSINGGASYAYTLSALTGAGATSFAYDFSSIPQSTSCLIRIRAYDGVNYGPYDVSSAVFTIEHDLAPTAPTGLTPSSGVIDRSLINRLSWTHNDPNSLPDPQSKFDLMYSLNAGSSWTTITQVTTNQYWDAPGGTFAHGQVLWKVRTYDQTDLSGPYSDQATFLVGDKPNAPTVTSPAGVIAEPQPTIEWSSAGQSGVQVQAITGVTTAWDSGTVMTTNKTIPCGITLTNSIDYTIQVRIINTDGLWSDWATSDISVSYTPPATPEIVVSQGIGYIDVSATNPEPVGSQPTVNFNAIYRRVYGVADWTRIASTVYANSNYHDYAVASGVTYEYRAVALGDNGTIAESDIENQAITFRGVWLHDVTDPGGTVYNFELDGTGKNENWQPEAVLNQFAGRNRPVVEFGESGSGKISANLQMRKVDADYAKLQSLVKRISTLCYRDGRGRKMFGVVLALPFNDVRYGNTTTITVNETSYEEAV